MQRSTFVRCALAVAVAVLASGSLGVSQAHVIGPTSFQDDFEYNNGTPLVAAPSSAYWQLSPYVPSGWTVATRASAGGVSALGTISALVASQRQGTPNEPIAFVKKDWGNFEFEMKAAWDRVVTPTSGVGMVFRAEVDPTSGLADRNNLYLFTAVNGPVQRGYPTGHAFELWKRVAGTYYRMLPQVNSWIDFSNSKMHTYKVSMSGNRIIAWVDGLQVFNTVDTPGDDQNGPDNVYKAPGPAFSSGAVGVRTSAAAALFDDVTVIGNPAYEGRATAVNIYGRTGWEAAIGSNAGVGTELPVQAADTGFQYHDHDFTEDVREASVPNSTGAPAGVVLFHTDGTSGTTTSNGQILGYAGSFTDQTGRTTVTITADAIRVASTSSCTGTTSSVDVVNLVWQVVARDANGHETVNQGNVTQLNAAPNQNLLDPNNTTGPLPKTPVLDPNNSLATAPVKITLHSRQATSDPQRVEAAALRITFYEDADGNVADPKGKPIPTPLVVSLDVAIGDVVAGVICASP